MRRRHALLAALLLAAAGPATAAEPPATAAEIRDAVTKALPLLQKGAAGHVEQRTCFACHNQALPMLALTTARAHGVPLASDNREKQLRFIADFLQTNRDNFRKGRGTGGQADTAGYALWTLDMGGWSPDDTTAAVAEYLLLRDQDRDHWRGSGIRPPSEGSPFTTTYVALRGLQAFGTAEQKERIEERLCTISDWLARTPAQETEDRVFRLWALQRVGASAAEVQAAARELLQSQRPGGGWAQCDDLQPDAYATGAALVALHEAAGLPTGDPVYQRGVKYLLGSQLADGSWHVHSRSKPFQTYFESGFPHGKDQFISLAASGWATTALALALPADASLSALPADHQDLPRPPR
jgi:hypothetical protein